MPHIVGASALVTDVGGDDGVQLFRPATDQLVADLDPAFAEHLLDIAGSW
jgi:hypothetical protein